MSSLNKLTIYPKRLKRLESLDQLLRTTGLPRLSQVASKFRCSKRTIELDLKYLRDHFGTEIIKKNGSYRVYFYENKELTQSPFKVDEADIMILLLGESALKQYKGTPFESKGVDAYHKIIEQIGSSDIKEKAQEIIQSVYFNPGNITTQYNPEIFIDIFNSIRNKEIIEISYFSARSNKVSDRKVAPYYLTNIEGDWYIIAHDYTSNEIRQFHVGRVKKIRETYDFFTIPKDFNIDKYLRQGFFQIRGGTESNVVLRFNKKAAVYVQDKHWHDTQEGKVLDDGSYELSFKTSGLDAVKRWVMQFGHDVMVCEPEQLRQDIVEEVKKIAQLYT